MPARERRNYRCADPNFGAQTLRYFVAKGRKGVRGYEQAHPCRVRGLPARPPYQLEAGGAAEIVGPRGLRSKCSCTSAPKVVGSTLAVPNVSTITLTGWATPIA